MAHAKPYGLPPASLQAARQHVQKLSAQDREALLRALLEQYEHPSQAQPAADSQGGTGQASPVAATPRASTSDATEATAATDTQGVGAGAGADPANAADPVEGIDSADDADDVDVIAVLTAQTAARPVSTAAAPRLVRTRSVSTMRTAPPSPPSTTQKPPPPPRQPPVSAHAARHHSHTMSQPAIPLLPSSARGPGGVRVLSHHASSRSLSAAVAPTTAGANMAAAAAPAFVPSPPTTRAYWCTVCGQRFVALATWQQHDVACRRRQRPPPPLPSQTPPTTEGSAAPPPPLLRPQRAWACGFCAAFLGSLARYHDHVAAHFALHGQTLAQWHRAHVLYGLLHQPGVHAAWKRRWAARQAALPPHLRPKATWLSTEAETRTAQKQSAPASATEDHPPERLQRRVVSYSASSSSLLSSTTASSPTSPSLSLSSRASSSLSLLTKRPMSSPPPPQTPPAIARAVSSSSPLDQLQDALETFDPAVDNADALAQQADELAFYVVVPAPATAGTHASGDGRQDSSHPNRDRGAAPTTTTTAAAALSSAAPPPTAVATAGRRSLGHETRQGPATAVTAGMPEAKPQKKRRASVLRAPSFSFLRLSKAAPKTTAPPAPAQSTKTKPSPPPPPPPPPARAKTVPMVAAAAAAAAAPWADRPLPPLHPDASIEDIQTGLSPPPQAPTAAAAAAEQTAPPSPASPVTPASPAAPATPTTPETPTTPTTPLEDIKDTPLPPVRRAVSVAVA